jgi:hypothetical protein
VTIEIVLLGPLWLNVWVGSGGSGIVAGILAGEWRYD